MTASPDTGRRVRTGEWTAVGWSFLYFFCVLSAYYVIRPVRDQLSAAVGSTQLPWFYGAVFVATLALTPVFAWLVGRYPRRIVVPAVYLFFIACLIGIPIGLMASRSDRFEKIVTPVIDTLQVLPSFCFIIPVVMLFRVGDVTAIIATVAFAGFIERGSISEEDGR